MFSLHFTPSRVIGAAVGLFSAASLATAVQAAPSVNSVDELIIRFDDSSINGPAQAERLTEALGQRFEFVQETSGGRLIFKLEKNQSIRAANGLAKAAERLGGVSFAEPNILLVPFAEPNDTYLNYQWHYYGPDANENGGLNAVNAWLGLDTSYTQATVAVLDTGQASHSDLNGNTVAGYDMISYLDIANDGDGRDPDPSDPGDNTDPGSLYGSSWHGTHVAGTIGAVTDNGSGVAGVGYDRVRLMPVRVLGVGGGVLSDVADGIVWAADNGANVINMSLGAGPSYPCDPNSAMQSSINYAVSKNVTVVVSAGNSNTDTSGFTPASCDNVINVAALNRNGGKANYSNYGDLIDLAAPGGEGSSSISTYVVSTANDGHTGPGNENYVGMVGTSMAAPHVAGLAALMYSEDSTLKPTDIESLLKNSARTFYATCTQCGDGAADAVAAMQSLSSGDSGGTGSTEEPTLQPPDTPASLGYLLQADGSVELFWGDVSTEEWYELEFSKKLRGKKWSNFEVIDAKIAAGTTVYPHAPSDGTYQYRLRASNSAGSSSWVVSDNVTIESSSSTDDTESGGGSGKCHPKKGC